MKLIPSAKVLAAYGSALVLMGGIAYATTPADISSFDPAPLEQTVATQGQELDNHEQRITALENASPTPESVTNTPTEPQTDAVTGTSLIAEDVPPTPTVTPSPTTKVIVDVVSDSSTNMLDPSQSYSRFKYTFSDGTSTEFDQWLTAGVAVKVGTVVPVDWNGQAIN